MALVGGVKIQDGLFLGDEFAAQDLEFVVANKVTHVVNTAARQVPNHWEPIGVKYLDLYWLDHDVQQLFDPRDELISGVCEFIDAGIALGESVLVHSVKGQSRSVAMMLVYLMRSHHWTLQKALDFIGSRRPGLAPRPSFIVQVSAFEARLARTHTLSSHWDQHPTDPEEIVLRNTFLNSRPGQVAEAIITDHQPRTTQIRFLDSNPAGSQHLAANPVSDGMVTIKSCLKGGRTRGSFQVPVPARPTPRKAAALRPVKPDAVTTDDLAPLRRAKFDPPASTEQPPKKQRASSAGSKDQKVNKDSALHRMRFAPMSKTGSWAKSGMSVKSYAPYGDGKGLELQGKAAKKSRTQSAPGVKGKGFSRTVGARLNA